MGRANAASFIDVEVVDTVEDFRFVHYGIGMFL